MLSFQVVESLLCGAGSDFLLCDRTHDWRYLCAQVARLRRYFHLRPVGRHLTAMDVGQIPCRFENIGGASSRNLLA